MTAPTTDRSAAIQIIDAVLAAGWTLSHVNDGEDDTKATTSRQAWDVIDTVDEARCWFTRDSDGHKAGIYFVLGNSPDEVACDYHLSLAEPIETLASRWDN